MQTCLTLLFFSLKFGCHGQERFDLPETFILLNFGVSGYEYTAGRKGFFFLFPLCFLPSRVTAVGLGLFQCHFFQCLIFL